MKTIISVVVAAVLLSSLCTVMLIPKKQNFNNAPSAKTEAKGKAQEPVKADQKPKERAKVKAGEEVKSDMKKIADALDAGKRLVEGEFSYEYGVTLFLNKKNVKWIDQNATWQEPHPDLPLAQWPPPENVKIIVVTFECEVVQYWNSWQQYQDNKKKPGLYPPSESCPNREQRLAGLLPGEKRMVERGWTHQFGFVYKNNKVWKRWYGFAQEEFSEVAAFHRRRDPTYQTDVEKLRSWNMKQFCAEQLTKQHIVEAK